MQLKKEQIERFIKLHEGLEGFDKYSQEEIEEIANGVANYYLTLYKMYQRQKKEENQLFADELQG